MEVSMDLNKSKIKISDMQISILDSMIDGVRLIDKNNNIIHVNESMKKHIGILKNSLILPVISLCKIKDKLIKI